MLWYVRVRGPYDGSYVGPFQVQQEASQWAKHMEIIKGNVFDFFPCSDEDIRQSIKLFGPDDTSEFCNPSQWELNNVIEAGYAKTCGGTA